MALDLFDGLNVVDLGQGISGPFCAKLFADLGARVVKVEPSSGDPSPPRGAHSPTAARTRKPAACSSP